MIVNLAKKHDVNPAVEPTAEPAIPPPSTKEVSLLFSAKISIYAIGLGSFATGAASVPALIQTPRMFMAGGQEAAIAASQLASSATLGVVAMFSALVATTVIPRFDELLRTMRSTQAELLRLRGSQTNIRRGVDDLHYALMQTTGHDALASNGETASIQIAHIGHAFRAETGRVFTGFPGWVSEIGYTPVRDGVRVYIIGEGIPPAFSRLLPTSAISGWRIVFSRHHVKSMVVFLWALAQVHLKAFHEYGELLEMGRLEVGVVDLPEGEDADTLVLIPRIGSVTAQILKYRIGRDNRLPPLQQLAHDSKDYSEALTRINELNRTTKWVSVGALRHWLGDRVIGSDNLLRDHLQPPQGLPDPSFDGYGGGAGGC